MLILEAVGIKKYYIDKLIVEVDNLKVYDGDRIGIVGLNGAGKTTLLNMLSRELEPDEGFVKLYGECSYITQLGDGEDISADEALAREFSVNNVSLECMSGGEKTRLKIAKGLSKDSRMLFADEPTCNLDLKGIKKLEDKLKNYDGAMMIISHDRALLDAVCNKILEVENRKIKIYNGNYSNYKKSKAMEIERQQFEYDEYTREKKKLEAAIVEKKERIRTMRDVPTRMGPSEARLHKGASKAKKKKLDKTVKAIESRMEHMDVKEKPKELPKTKIDIQDGSGLYGKIVIECKALEKYFGERKLFSNADLQIYNGRKTAIIGDNGTGKTTFLKMIMNRDKGIWVSGAAKMAYFSQDLSILDEEKTILENVLEKSIYPEEFARIILARLLFTREDVYKRVGVLSGGERVKAAFAKIFLMDVNMIVLDEPTNYLDISSQEALESVLGEYDGTLIFISHDRRFIEDIADSIIIFENGKITAFNGTYEELNCKILSSSKPNIDETRIRLMQLENRIAVVMGKLSIPSREDNIQVLDEEFKVLMKEIRELKKIISEK
jgi:macrolide transport system ATP-binding/permease protein